LEGVKHAWEPPLITNAVLNVGEVTMLVYMVGALGQAFHWSWHQWSKGQPIFAAGGKTLLKQFLPKRIKMESILRPPRFLVRLIIFILGFLLILAVIEMTNLTSEPRLDHLNAKIASSGKATTALPRDDSVRLGSHLKPMTNDSFLSLFLSGFNSISGWILGGVLLLSAVAIISVAAVVVYNRRR